PRLREAAIHAKKIGREQRRFLPARASPDLEQGVFFVVRIARQEQDADLALELALPIFELWQLGASQRPELGIVERFAVLGDLLADALPLGESLYDLAELRALAAELGQLLMVTGDARVAHQLLDLLVAPRQGLELVGREHPGSVQSSALAPGLSAGASASRREVGLLVLRVVAAEAIEAASRVHQALLAGVERMAGTAEVDRQLGARRARLKLVTAGAGHRDDLVLRVNSVFHLGYSDRLPKGREGGGP